MAKIIYGVSGEGMGHAIRSKVVIDHLLKKHKIVIVAGGKAHEYLSQYYSNVHKIFALRIVYGNNKVRNLKTLTSNIKGYPKGKKESLRRVHRIVKEFKPDILITDFEFLTDNISKRYRIPSISIDNIHMVSKCYIKIPKAKIGNYVIIKNVVDSIVKNSRYYFITTFFYPKKKKRNVFLVPPILREKIINIKPKIKDYVLVYQTSETNKTLIPTLKRIDEKFIVYGFNKSESDKNIIFRKFNEHQFYGDIGNCKAVITNGGFTLIGEALYLKKPILSVPIRKQFEQICNAVYIEKLGYGEYHEKLTKKNIEEFINNLSLYMGNLKKFLRENNEIFFKKLDKTINLLVRR